MNLQPPTREQIGKALKSARKKSKVSLAVIFAQTGISQSAVWRLEQGRSAPSLLNLWKLCTLYQCSADDILQISKPN